MNAASPPSATGVTGVVSTTVVGVGTVVGPLSLEIPVVPSIGIGIVAPLVGVDDVTPDGFAGCGGCVSEPVGCTPTSLGAAGPLGGPGCASSIGVAVVQAQGPATTPNSVPINRRGTACPIDASERRCGAQSAARAGSGSTLESTKENSM